MHYRLSLSFIVVVSMFLFSCGGSGSGGDSMPGTVPNGGINGVAHDGVLNGSTITVRSYTTGAVLGTGTTDVNGNYSVAIQTEEPTLLIEAGAGFYVEESSGTSVNLAPDQKLRAVINNYSVNSNVKVSITPFTNLAAGLALYRVNHGMSASAAIATANRDVSSMLGFDIINTVPRDITNSANVAVYTSDEYSYGFMCAAISSWTKYASEKSGELEPATVNSISFAQIMYNDISADGLLDGVGFDPNKQLVNLSLGAVTVDVNVYRYALAAHLIKMVNSDKNKTHLTESKLLPYATTYAGNTSALFGSATPLGFSNGGRPSVLITSPAPDAVLSGIVQVTATASSQGTIDTATLKLDHVASGGTPVTAIAPNPNAPTFSINIGMGNPNPNSLSVTVVDSFGISVSQTMPIRIYKSPPAITLLYGPTTPGQPMVWSGSYTAQYSPMQSMSIIYTGAGRQQCSFTATSDTAGTWSCPFVNRGGDAYVQATNSDGYTCASLGGSFTYWANGRVICQ